MNFSEEAARAYGEQNWQLAESLYTKAVELDPKNHALYSNIALCIIYSTNSKGLMKQKKWKPALEYAEKSTEINSSWSKVIFLSSFSLILGLFLAR
jgi:hypothetical protein